MSHYRPPRPDARGRCRRFIGRCTVITIPELREGMEEMHAHIEKTLGWHLEGIFLSHLHEVIEARKDWWTGDELG